VIEISLALSVGANVYFMTRHGEAAPPPPPAQPAPTAPVSAPAPVTAPVASVTATTAPACPPVVRTDCQAVENKLADAEAKLEEHLPPDERYKHAGRSLDAETRARAVLDPIFAPLSKSPHAYDVECHGAVCKLDVVDKAIPRETWMEAVQSPGGFAGWAFSGFDTYATMGTPTETAQSMLMGAIGHALNPDAGLRECAGDERPAGTLTLDIALDPATRRLNVSASGSLANEHVGSCVRMHVQTLLDAIKAPGDLASFARTRSRSESRSRRRRAPRPRRPPRASC